jgi:peptidoglycan/xylan/chitin deacetylase (PgdA/CDA1 family)
MQRQSTTTPMRPRLRAATVSLLVGVLVACGGPPAAEPSPTSGPGTPTGAPTSTPSSSVTAGSPSPSAPRPSSPAQDPVPGDGPPDGEEPSPLPLTPTPQPPATDPPPTVEQPPAADQPAPGAIPDGWRGLDVERLPTSERLVALTFDGGGSDAAVGEILGTLDRYDVPATFFVTGEFARAYPDAVAAMSAAGHPVGNHSDTHPDFTETTTAEILDELAAAEASIAAITGRTTRPLFRFPFGARTDLDIRVVNDAGYIPFRWTVDSLGWQGTSGGKDADAVRQRVLDTAGPGQIVLMHVGAHPGDGSTLDADALPGLIEGLVSAGYGFVDLEDALG